MIQKCQHRFGLFCGLLTDSTLRLLTYSYILYETLNEVNRAYLAGENTPIIISESWIVEK